jgi:hypothetical protein
MEGRADFLALPKPLWGMYIYNMERIIILVMHTQAFTDRHVVSTGPLHGFNI